MIAIKCVIILLNVILEIRFEFRKRVYCRNAIDAVFRVLLS